MLGDELHYLFEREYFNDDRKLFLSKNFDSLVSAYRGTLTRQCFDFRAERNTDQVHTALPRMTTRWHSFSFFIPPNRTGPFEMAVLALILFTPSCRPSVSVCEDVESTEK